MWIGSKLWTSGAIYSPMRNDRYRAWLTRRLYYECRYCHYARTTTLDDGTRGETKDCEACGGVGTFGPARPWLRPPGFAHPVSKAEGTSPDDQPARSYATRAKLTMHTPPDESKWARLNDYIRVHHTRQHLLVTNRGPREEGYTYCTKCGFIEPTALLKGVVGAAHRKPYPDPRDTNCSGGGATKGLVLGTDLISDVLLVSMSVRPPLTLTPGLLATEVALRTISEALTKAACARLELEVNELQAEYRPALTAAGRDGREAEIYLYDTLPGGAGFAPRVGQLGLLVFEDAAADLGGVPRELRPILLSLPPQLQEQVRARPSRSPCGGQPSPVRAARYGTDARRRAPRAVHGPALPGSGAARRRRPDPGAGQGAPRSLASQKWRCRSSRPRGPGRQFVIGLHGPLTPDEPSDEALRDLKEFSARVR